MLQSFFQKGILEAGCDEAGRGCLAGPVFAAAVILPADYKHPLLNDSKKLTAAQRMSLREEIKTQSLAWAVASVDHEEIDRINILKASMLAMHKAIDQLKVRPELLLIDGNRFTPYFGIPHQCIVKGDGKLLSIAAASILAKTFRDDFMLEAAQQYPHYGWANNKGYGTLQHVEALYKWGETPLHRKTFKWKKQELAASFSQIKERNKK